MLAEASNEETDHYQGEAGNDARRLEAKKVHGDLLPCEAPWNVRVVHGIPGMSALCAPSLAPHQVARSCHLSLYSREVLGQKWERTFTDSAKLLRSCPRLMLV
jgi:hypothetical protein